MAELKSLLQREVIIRMLMFLGIILLIFWLGGLLFHIAGGFIHILLVIGLILLLARFIGSRA